MNVEAREIKIKIEARMVDLANSLNSLLDVICFRKLIVNIYNFLDVKIQF